MTQDGARGQGFHAALIAQGMILQPLKQFPQLRAEMLQEIRPHDVDLGPDRP